MDLIADVLQQADITKVKLATLKLVGSQEKRIAKGHSADFQTIGAAHKPKDTQAVAKLEFRKDQSRVPGYQLDGEIPSTSSRENKKAEAMRGLETILATKMVEAMMPKDQGDLYGEGTAGEIWRGFHVETMGKALASQGLLSSTATEVGKSSEGTFKNRRTKSIVPFAG